MPPPLLLLLLPLCFLAAVPQYASCTPLTQAEKQEALDFHNHLRRSVVPPAADMNALGWDTRLEELAQRAANSCVFEHNYGRDYAGLGENLYSGWRRNFTEILMYMFLEREQYDYASSRCVTGVGKYPALKGCGHYLQIATAAVARVGCAVHWCTDKYLAACEYDRYMTRPPYATGESGTKCQHQMCGYEYNGLCYSTAAYMPQAPSNSLNCKIRCLNNGVQMDNGFECKCQCPAGYSGVRCQNYYTTRSEPTDCQTQDILCQNGGTPKLVDGVCKCECAEGYRGSECEENIKLVDNSVFWYLGQQMRYASYYPVSPQILTALPLSNSLMFYTANALNTVCKVNYRLCCPEAAETTSAENFVEYNGYSVTRGYPRQAIDGSLKVGVHFLMRPEQAAKCNLGISPLVNRNALLEASRAALVQVRTVASYVGVQVPRLQ